MSQPKPTPTEAVEMLRNFVHHPHIRCFNHQEYVIAETALAVVAEAVADKLEIVGLPNKD
jgi:hypothetical protein